MKPWVCGWSIKRMPCDSVIPCSVLFLEVAYRFCCGLPNNPSKEKTSSIKVSIRKKNTESRKKLLWVLPKEDICHIVNHLLSTSLQERQWWVSRAASYEVPLCRPKHHLIKKFLWKIAGEGSWEFHQGIQFSGSWGLLLPLGSNSIADL